MCPDYAVQNSAVPPLKSITGAKLAASCKDTLLHLTPAVQLGILGVLLLGPLFPQPSLNVAGVCMRACTARLSSFSPSLSLRALEPPFFWMSASSLRASSSSLSSSSAWIRSSSLRSLHTVKLGPDPARRVEVCLRKARLGVAWQVGSSLYNAVSGPARQLGLVSQVVLHGARVSCWPLCRG